ncbi:hypothetical protein ACKGJO_06520 [Gracilimonas sp. Q87]|uniref:hypothetical protein n=1 Tax=Gracilimonas sp. Q87 TaxID=3384766 RepID=UPI0039840E22
MKSKQNFQKGMQEDSQAFQEGIEKTRQKFKESFYETQQEDRVEMVDDERDYNEDRYDVKLEDGIDDREDRQQHEMDMLREQTTNSGSGSSLGDTMDDIREELENKHGDLLNVMDVEYEPVYTEDAGVQIRVRGNIFEDGKALTMDQLNNELADYHELKNTVDGQVEYKENTRRRGEPMPVRDISAGRTTTYYPYERYHQKAKDILKTGRIDAPFAQDVMDGNAILDDRPDMDIENMDILDKYINVSTSEPVSIDIPATDEEGARAVTFDFQNKTIGDAYKGYSTLENNLTVDLSGYTDLSTEQQQIQTQYSLVRERMENLSKIVESYQRANPNMSIDEIYQMKLTPRDKAVNDSDPNSYLYNPAEEQGEPTSMAGPKKMPSVFESLTINNLT